MSYQPTGYCDRCGKYTEITKHLTTQGKEYRCSACLNQPEDFHKQPHKEEEISEMEATS